LKREENMDMIPPLSSPSTAPISGLAEAGE
jgi:hypothetical protein